MVMPGLKLHSNMDFAREPPRAVNAPLCQDAFKDVRRLVDR